MVTAGDFKYGITIEFDGKICQIIEFQLEDYLNGKNFAQEVDRIYRLGRLTPNEWMIQATGNDLSVEPMIHALQKVIKK